MSFIQLVLNWYQTHKRSLPWRENTQPYPVWLSEIILQQTRVNQGIVYYNKFIHHYPKVQNLAKADQQEVLNMWQGLGYYSRAINLHKAAKIVAFDYDGEFPTSFKTLKKLPGVGNYTAAAIASICFDEKVPAIDGNAYRVYARYYGIEKDISDSNAWRYFFDFAKSIMPSHHTGNYNQSIMELGATVCVPKKPQCNACPIQKECVAYETGQIENLPVKTRKVKVQKRYIQYYFVAFNNQFLIKKRTSKDIWKNLYDFPSVEQKQGIDEPLMFQAYQPKKKYTVKHILTHRQLFLSFYIIETTEKVFNALSQDYQVITFQDIVKYPFPKPIADFLSNHIKV